MNTLFQKALLGFAVFLSVVGNAKVDVYFSPNGGVRERILLELGDATETLNIAMYSLSDRSIVAKLKELSASGVQVRLILNQANKYKEKSLDLEKAGIDVRYINIVMHHKFAVIDAETLLTGSQNWSASAETSYDEDFLVFEDEEARVAAFVSEFNMMWNKARDFEGPASTGEELADFEADFADIYFTSQNFEVRTYRGAWSFRSKVGLSEGVAGLAVLDAINGAQKSIKIAHAHFRRSDFYEALQGALARGVKVEMVLDAQEYGGRVPRNLPEDDTNFMDEKLALEGATVKYKMYSRFWNFVTAKQMHSKYMIVDGRKVLTGSFNWSKNAELNTLENLISLGAREAKIYQENFEKIMSYGEGTLASLIANILDDAKSYCVFVPITLSPEDIDSLRKSYPAGACRK